MDQQCTLEGTFKGNNSFFFAYPYPVGNRQALEPLKKSSDGSSNPSVGFFSHCTWEDLFAT